VETAKKEDALRTALVFKTPKIAIFRMCYGENGTVKFVETWQTMYLDITIP
jgi:hypothetical protein